MPKQITRLGTRILTPDEYELLRGQLTENTKTHHQTLLDGILFTGMRGEEYRRFLQHPEWYDVERRSIQLKRDAVKKKKVVIVERDVRLSNFGVRAIGSLINWKLSMPNKSSWRKTLRLAAEKSGIGVEGVNTRMTRKTWESWLLASYPDNLAHILLSQGHTQTVAIGHYLSVKFTPEEKQKIKTYTEGWLQ